MLKKLTFISLAGIFIAIGVNAFIIPLHLINGGVIGISLLFNYAWGFNLGLTIFMINLPIYLFTLKYERLYFFNGLYGMIVSSIMIECLFPLRNLFHLYPWFSSIIGGLFIGTGIGIMLRHHCSHGGIDLLALVISKYFHINPGFIILIIDAFIIVYGMIILKDYRLIYSLFTVISVGSVASLLTSLKSILFIRADI